MLYPVDPSTGGVRDRPALPSAAERTTLRGDRIVVRCDDAWVAALLAPARAPHRLPTTPRDGRTAGK